MAGRHGSGVGTQFQPYNLSWRLPGHDNKMGLAVNCQLLLDKVDLPNHARNLLCLCKDNIVYGTSTQERLCLGQPLPKSQLAECGPCLIYWQ